MKTILNATAMVVLLASPAAAQTTRPAAPEKAAVFQFQFAHLGQLPPTQADKARLPHITQELRDLLAASGKYQIVSTAPVAAEAQGNDLRSCGGCADDYARKLGAELAVTGQVQKVSDLILNITVYFKNIRTNAPEHAYDVSIRGDTDESFKRGIAFLVSDQILKK